ncbi:hypothetical protein QBC38DRAFT_502669 [Podospora fimiseda]|uniref:Uncharacterized protein n=1 Tax=Podospora fimiseda TaxID=252190 RepID=A0AAN7BIJ1_9PEZI|nr:hypothetical protein QBC38DRAFT_502669 [Podospora fimiseda]
MPASAAPPGDGGRPPHDKRGPFDKAEPPTKDSCPDCTEFELCGPCEKAHEQLCRMGERRSSSAISSRKPPSPDTAKHRSPTSPLSRSFSRRGATYTFKLAPISDHSAPTSSDAGPSDKASEASDEPSNEPNVDDQAGGSADTSGASGETPENDQQDGSQDDSSESATSQQSAPEYTLPTTPTRGRRSSTF